MPLYEGINIGDEPKVMVLDIGAAYTKCGVAGETGPRCIIPSKVTNSRTGQVTKVWDYRSSNELYETLKDLLHNIIFRHLLVTPKDRRVVVVESLLCPSDFREALAKVLFKHYEVGSVLFAPSHLLSMLTIGSNIGLVMDVGYRETLVVPVYEGIPIMKGWQSIPFAGKAIESRIKTQLMEHGTVCTPEQQHQAVSSVPDTITEEILEDIKVRCCFVTEYSRGQQIQEVTMRGGHANKLPQPPPDTDYPLDGGSVLSVTGRIREHSCEVLFEQDNDETSIATLMLEALVKIIWVGGFLLPYDGKNKRLLHRKFAIITTTIKMMCPIDTRHALASNVLVIGGTAMLPGFYHRLQHELRKLIKKPIYSQQLGIKKFKFHKAPAKENYTAWLGGALIGALETLPSKSLSRDAYLQKGKLPDWCCIDSDYLLEEKPQKPST